MSAASAQDVAEIKVLGSRTTVKAKPAVDGVNPSPLYKALEKRVNDAAKALCQEIGKQYPDSSTDDASGAKQALNRAMVQVRALRAGGLYARTVRIRGKISAICGSKP